MTACTDDLTDGTTPSGGDKGTGEMVLFTVGTTNNAVTSSRAHENSYYMASTSRFVCRMYYCSRPNDPTIDVTDGTDFMAWLKVDGNVGNSLYWNKFYEPLQDPDTEGYGGHDNLGNDYSADAFYWQNRNPHVFLAMTDLNRAKEADYRYGVSQGNLKLTPPDMSYTVSSGGTKMEWVPYAYKIEGIDQTFSSWEALKNYIENLTETDRATFNETQAASPAAQKNWENAKYEYAYGWSCKFSKTNSTTTEDGGIQTTGPVRYLMYYDTFPFYESDLPTDKIAVRDDKGKLIAYTDKYGIYLCNVIYKKDSEGKDTQEIDKYVKTDDYGNTLYNEESPRYTFYYTELKQQKKVLDETTYNVNRYDLTRKPVKDADGNIASYGINSMSEQPDICQAITKQAPLGATQAANRVNLYFMHQFSQVQVNIKNASDASVNIGAGQLLKVELLGVTEEGYVCVDLKDNGEITHAPMYKAVDISKYTPEQLAVNQYGTSFEMFPMNDATATGYLKSYNCITFGQLQAIRITWREQDTEITHTATFRVTETNLQNLQSGVRYVWNMELRRGTLAVIRTEVDNWIVPSGNELMYGSNGTISN